MYKYNTFDMLVGTSIWQAVDSYYCLNKCGPHGVCGWMVPQTAHSGYHVHRCVCLAGYQGDGVRCQGRSWLHVVFITALLHINYTTDK